MSTELYTMVRTLENKIAIAENNEQNTIFVTIDVMKSILAMLKEQQKRIEKLESDKGWDESPDMMGKW